MAQGILLIEDEGVLASNIKRYLDRRGYDVVTASTAADGLRLFEKGEFDLVLLDLNLPDRHGLEVLGQVLQHDARVKVVCVTGNADVQVAVKAMKAGAYDYVAKPVVLSELKILIDKAVGQDRLEGALTYYSSRDASTSGLDKLMGRSSVMQDLRTRITAILNAERNLVDGAPAAILIRGETGTGKDLVARALHFDGHRRAGPYIEFNCAALPVHLLESELFGHERGAFTDAKVRKMGLVEAAHGGTLFLDEIGDTDPAVQLKLLKLLEDRTVRRVGGLRERVVDVRFISATNLPLEDLVKTGRFRADLYYRLHVITIDVPPLRTRVGDPELLAQHFLSYHAKRYNRMGVEFSEGALSRIRSHSWPGNVRELRNAIEQAVLYAPDSLIQDVHLGLTAVMHADRTIYGSSDGSEDGRGLKTSDEVAAGVVTLDGAERTLISRTLALSKGNVTQAAKLLGVSRDTLRYRLEKYGIG